MQSNDVDLVDRLAMALSAALLLGGIVVAGLIETLTGVPRGAAPVTNDAGEVIATPTIDPNVRVALVVGAILVLLAYALYRVAVPHVGATGTGEATTEARA
ncbi:hypothetical protein [Halobacterium sp. R2-5]|uniref:hypothetical protein n=1 Tax=Halobacterium sp. R2-5 TaxID=2715751 RepID=UPI00142218A6|nr:hypothetical protein [Halobacterium sp. R2-5]NIB98274.1 hypothetical protein [Halobacterium sp. R2-5]